MDDSRTWDLYREPFNLKLFLLQMLQKWYVFVLSALGGALLLGGGYFLVHVVFAPAREYQADIICYMEYAVDPDESTSYATDYFNEYTWNEWIVCDEIQEMVAEAVGCEITETEFKSYVSTTVPADVRLQTISVVTNDPDLSLLIARCYEEWLPSFAEGQRELDSIRIVDSPEQAYLVEEDVRTLRAALLGGLIGLFICCMILWLTWLADDRIYLPEQLLRRHGLKVLGADGQEELSENVRYVVGERQNIALVGTSASAHFMETLPWFQSTFPDKHWEAVMGTLQYPEGAERLRKMDGVIFVAQAGADTGALIERVLSCYRQQEIPLTGAVLWGCDQKLLRRYYGIGSFGQTLRGRLTHRRKA